MKKKLVLLVLFIFCCGCSAKYELNFLDDKISENLTVKFDRGNLTDNDIKSFYSNSFYAIGRDKLYKFDSSKSNRKNININLNYVFDVSEFTHSNIANSCFEYFSFLSDDSKYYIFANGAFRCLTYEYVNLDSADIVISTNHKVLENNADEVKRGKYIWHINKDSKLDTSIKFVVDRSVDKSIPKIDYKSIIIGFSVVIASGLLIVVLMAIKNKKVNKI